MIFSTSHSFNKVTLLFFVLTICTLQIISQDVVQRQIRKFNSNEGLSHNIVNDILQDELGYIWIATEDGLNRYDGYDFSTYRFETGWVNDALIRSPK